MGSLRPTRPTRYLASHWWQWLLMVLPGIVFWALVVMNLFGVIDCIWWRVASWESLPPGIADSLQIMTALKDIGSDGCLSIEDFPNDVPVEQKVKDAIDYLKSLEASDERVMPA